MDNSYETKTSPGTIAAVAVPLAVIISCCLSCCRYYMRNENAKKLKNIRRIQQSRSLQPTNEQLQYRIIGLYRDNGNSAAFIAYPKTQDGHRIGGERLDNCTSDNDTQINLPDESTYTPTNNPPAYEDIINRNAAAIASFNSRTHKVVDEKRLAISDDSTSIPKVNPPAYEDII